MTKWAPSLSSTSPQPPLAPSLQCEAPTLPCLPPLAYAPMQPGPAAVHLSLYCNHLITLLPPPTFHQNEYLCQIFLTINIYLGTKFSYPRYVFSPVDKIPLLKNTQFPAFLINYGPPCAASREASAHRNVIRDSRVVCKVTNHKCIG